MKKSLFDDTGLKAYEAKRNFRRTSEPKPRLPKRVPKKKQLMFVIQKHDASRLHYDFRLEMEGVLKSWAVPKGIPMTRGEKRLAIHVEDHPMDYANFEGTIPEGNYGAGTVMVWDTG
ncbi:MAG: DNA polymerase ligase N-terminal domain-containing protein, partial [Verrucomicrobiota bacterium]